MGDLIFVIVLLAGVIFIERTRRKAKKKKAD